MTLSRRRFIQAVGVSAAAGASSSVWARSTRRNESVVLYSSVDDALLAEAVKLAERETGLKIKVVGDTEATKTTGLVQRLIAERDRPKADVWWSSEAMGTCKLASEGVLAEEAVATLAGLDPPWPAMLRQPTWTGFACRGRVMVVNTKRVAKQDIPRRLGDLISPTWKSRIGIARPQFGTTRGHCAALMVEHGEPAYSAWLDGLRENRVRWLDGNATVVRACAMGEIDVGLTDTDDVHAGIAKEWPVEMVFESVDRPGLPDAPGIGRTGDLTSTGPLLIPNTIARVNNGPNPDGARRLIDVLLSATSERMLARSESKNLPTRPGLDVEFPECAIPNGRHVDWSKAADVADRAIELASR